MPPDENELFVEDQHCGISGVIRRNRISQSVGEYGDPRETATACDLAERISPDPNHSNATGQRDSLVS